MNPKILAEVSVIIIVLNLGTLTASLADDAKSAGCEPVVYQSVLWWCFVYMPVVPRSVYFVLPCIECDDPDGDAIQYRAIPG